jgi:hypothetical protein
MAKKLILLAMAIGAVAVFIYPTKALAVLSRREVEQPRTLGLVPATSGYVDLPRWDEVIDVQSKPIVAAVCSFRSGRGCWERFRG